MKSLLNQRTVWLLIILALCVLVPFQAFADETVQLGDPNWRSREAGTAVNSTDEPATDGVFAVLYEDGTLVFQCGNTPEEGRAVTEIYPVDMSGYDSCEAVPWYANRDLIIQADIVSDIAPESVAFWFMGCNNMKEFSGVGNLKLSRATTMRSFFRGCANLKTLNLMMVDGNKRWDTSGVTDMSGVFYGCASLTELDLSALNTSSLSNLEEAFAGCTSLKKAGVARWNVSKVENMKGMFRGCSSLKELELSGWDTPRVTDMSEMFCQCGNLASIKVGNGFNTTQVTSSNDMFAGCSALKGGNGTPYSPAHTDAAYACIDAGAEQPGYFSEGIFAIRYADGTLAIQHGETPDGREVVKIYPVDMSTRYAMSDTQVPNTPWFDDREFVERVVFKDHISPEYADLWFYGMTNLKKVLNGEILDLSHCSRIMDLFHGDVNLERVDVSSWDTSHITAAQGVFYGCSSLTELDVSSWDTSKMEDIRGMFSGCSNLSELDVSGFETACIKDFGSVFRNCSKLTEIDVSNWNTSKAEQFHGMFWGCTGLTMLNLTSWDTASCFNYGNMFRDDINLTTILASDKFVVNEAEILKNYDERGRDIFTNCPALVGSNGTTYDKAHTDYTYLRFDAANAPGYLSGGFKPPSTVPNMPEQLKEIAESAFEGCAFTYIVLGDGVETIGPRAFADCESLAYVFIPNSVHVIAEDAFFGSNEVVIGCISESDAEAFAEQNGIPYRTVG